MRDQIIMLIVEGYSWSDFRQSHSISVHIPIIQHLIPVLFMEYHESIAFWVIGRITTDNKMEKIYYREYYKANYWLSRLKAAIADYRPATFEDLTKTEKSRFEDLG